MSRENPQDRSLALCEYTERYCDGTLSAEQTAELERSLRDDPSALDAFVLYMEVHSRIAWNARAHAEDEHDWPSDANAGNGMDCPAATESPLAAPFPSLSTTRYPLPANFVGGPVFSYMVATVILGVMLLSAWVCKITHVQPQIVETPSPTVPSDVRPELVFVGHISGMKDCRWADPRIESYAGASVPLNRRYALSSGLMEITYKTGAKVILEGPCTYEVDSHAGGYLALGKLTARIEERVKPQAVSPSPLSPLPSPLFSVRTPTAIVTDLGTEFGVKVGENGNTTSHVFQGLVQINILPSPASGRRPGGEGVVLLHENESARVERVEGTGNLRLVRSDENDRLPQFVRRIYQPPKFIDLLDVVAGGNGLGRQRELGIDPTTGMQDTMFFAGGRGGDRLYRKVGWHPLIDGVFVPDGGTGAVQVDSAGHLFGAFPHTCGEAAYSIWARAAEITQKNLLTDRAFWVYQMGRGDRYMPEKRGLLAMNSNSGITFDLEAIRRAHPGLVPSGFRTVVALADRSPPPQWKPPPGWNGVWVADVWILVDGKLKQKRERLRARDGAVNINVKLDPDDRFLTLVVTDGGDMDRSGDCLLFGDPVLDTMPSLTEMKK